MINLKKLVISIIIPLLFGFIGYLLGGDNSIYSSIVTPSFAPPGAIFPIVWTILYVLMGISFYIITNSNDTDITTPRIIYYLQLIVNAIWPLLFFRFNLFFIAFIWILLLIALVAYMIYLFYKIKPIAAYLQIPYLLWLIFASILNFSIFILN